MNGTKATRGGAANTEDGRYVLVQTAIPDYRQAVLREVCKALGPALTIYAGEHYFESSIKTAVDLGSNLRSARNRFFVGRRLLFQLGVIGPSIAADTVILELNPRVVNVWIVLVIRRLLNKRTVLWGHAWPRKGKEARTDYLRHVMRTLASEVLVYTHTQAEELRRKMQRKVIRAAPNALYAAADMRPERRVRNGFICVGRLVPRKRPLLLLQAFRAIFEQLPAEVDLLIVGDGPERARCERFIKASGMTDRVHLLGHVGDMRRLKRLYSSALASISPGYVGLSVIQSFSFGCPVIVADNEDHSPEIEAVKPGFNAVLFEAKRSGKLADAMMAVYARRNAWGVMSEEIAAWCRQEYSVDMMAARIVDSFIGKREADGERYSERQGDCYTARSR